MNSPFLQRLYAIFAVLALLQACSTTKITRPDPDNTVALPASITSDLAWNNVAFYIDWPVKQAPAWHLDALLAHRICQEVLDRHRTDIRLWRFHRRAIRDATGHRFSFKYYGEPGLATSIRQEIVQHPLTIQLLAAGIVTRIETGSGKNDPQSAIADTSDPAWPAPVRASWPYFAMGISQSWLSLIDAVAGSATPTDPDSLQAQLEFYRLINEQVSEYWRKQGGHAYLHHLNALFGYQQIIIREHGNMRF